MRTLYLLCLAVLIGCGTLASLGAWSQSNSLTTLHDFTAPVSAGYHPRSPLLFGSDGNLYGTASEGGPNDTGTVYRLTPSGLITVLHAFAPATQDPTTQKFINADGVLPRTLLLAPDGAFYGDTLSGGTSGDGTIYKVTQSGVFTLLHTFNRLDGQGPRPLILASDGNFYGTTEGGGANNTGTVFRMTPAGVLTTLHTFSSVDNNGDNADGKSPHSLIQGSDGNFYGTAVSGGTAGAGTIFMITPSGAFATLHSFTGQDGSSPDGGMAQGTDGNFYGTAYSGGANGTGVIYRITPTGTLTVLHSFAAYDTNGSTNPDGVNPFTDLLRGADGSFYGNTLNGGLYGNGTIFRITSAGFFTLLHALTYNEGSAQQYGLTQGPDGNFYGGATYGGPYGPSADYGFGLVFKMTPGGVLTVLYNFSDGLNRDGLLPKANVIQGSDGCYYGTTSAGGADGQGTVFKVSPTGSVITLHSFTCADGSSPEAALVQGGDGNFYGTTYYGGPYNTGTVFKISPGGDFVSLYAFSEVSGPSAANPNGANPAASLVQGSDGNFYGTTYYGGKNGTGTVFQISPGGTLVTLHTFTSVTSGYTGPNADGAYPNALTMGTDGYLYGTTFDGGANSSGTAFKMAVTGTFALLHVFTGNDGWNPVGLTQGADGNFYGATQNGSNGQANCGTVYRVTPTGGFALLYSFNGVADGCHSNAMLVRGADGNFYGTTADVTNTRACTVFRVTPAGALTTISTFPNVSPVITPHGVVLGSDGNFYGTTQNGGPNGYGSVFRLNAPTILFENPNTGQLAWWHLNTNYQSGGSLLYPNQDPKWKVAALADFNGDEQTDILFQNPATGQMAIWYMNDNYQVGAAFVYPTPDPAWKAVGAADFNGDGNPDILFQNTGTGQLSIWYMNNNYAVKGAFVYPALDPALKVVGVGDFNGDGKPDILFQNTNTGQLSIWYMNNNNAVKGAFVYPTPDAHLKAIGVTDVNGDGQPDIVFRNTSTGQLSIWYMNNNYANSGAYIYPTPPSGLQVVGVH